MERKNLRGMHFKPPDQAWQPTFASGKPDDTGREETGTEVSPFALDVAGHKGKIRNRGGKSETSGIKTGRAVEYRVVSTGRSSGMERHDPGCRRF